MATEKGIPFTGYVGTGIAACNLLGGFEVAGASARLGEEGGCEGDEGRREWGIVCWEERGESLLDGAIHDGACMSRSGDERTPSGHVLGATVRRFVEDHEAQRKLGGW